MLNNTSSYFRPKLIDFKVMGLDEITSEFLNWTLQNRNNLEFIKHCKTLDLVSTQAIIHFDHLKVIQRIDDALCHKRF